MKCSINSKLYSELFLYQLYLPAKLKASKVMAIVSISTVAVVNTASFFYLLSADDSLKFLNFGKLKPLKALPNNPTQLTKLESTNTTSVQDEIRFCETYIHHLLPLGKVFRPLNSHKTQTHIV